ncbi:MULTISPECIES: RagB/SusD family nutrient uptake outer membrane protein [unclassified Sphingobacterium]|uniref:RagB/SusD family nutrient uptake outer membrane protein n=1 Tax=unclassified Sphingobacterium TaxID=2609468 RepID=UPI0025DCC77F|nr:MULTISPECIES: RagB/SusD family nutrient uptake outer membrane protein [unclassified Sphingobacterium]
MKKIGVLILFFLCLGSSSCDKWLDVRPKDEIYVDDALKDRIGFVKALAGIYLQLAEPGLYGRELKFGMLDVMAGYWIVDSQHDYYAENQFDFHNLAFQQKRDVIWSKMYGAIYQCNLMLSYLDNIRSDVYYNLVKGELLGLRAYIHLEIFKLFGPVTLVKGMNTPAVPYYSAVSKQPEKFSTSKDFLSKVERDLLEAKSLLREDPIITKGKDHNGNVEGQPYNALLDRRGIRMNYYAVMALLVRQAQWAEDRPKAIQRGEELLTQLSFNKSIRLIDEEDIILAEEVDRRWTVENIWGLYVKDLKRNMDGIFDGDLYISTVLIPDFPDFLAHIYTQGSGSISDYRYKMWGVKDFFIKFWILDSEESTRPANMHFFEMQLINLPEIYLILAESYLNQNINQSLKYLDVLRIHRGLPKLAGKAGISLLTLQDYIMDEVRREYIGEGYLYTYYKRLFHPIYRNGYSIAASEAIFMFPLPSNEQLLNPQ